MYRSADIGDRYRLLIYRYQVGWRGRVVLEIFFSLDMDFCLLEIRFDDDEEKRVQAPQYL